MQRLYHKNQELQDHAMLSDVIAHSTASPDKYLMGKSIRKQLKLSTSSNLAALPFRNHCQASESVVSNSLTTSE